MTQVQNTVLNMKFEYDVDKYKLEQTKFLIKIYYYLLFIYLF